MAITWREIGVLSDAAGLDDVEAEEREQEHRQSLNAARGACEWLRYHLIHTDREPLEGPILLLIKGFEILNEKELRQAAEAQEGVKG